MTATQPTTETLREFAGWNAPTVRVDRAEGVIHGVKILGLRSRNGRVYLPEALSQAAPLYEGAKVNLNHPKGHAHQPRDYQDRIGSIHNVELRDGEGLFANFHFNPKHAQAEQHAWDAEHAPGNVGISHHVQARTARRGEELVVEAITRVESVDLVADPATTRGLFEGNAKGEPRPDLANLSVELLTEHRADLVEAIRAGAVKELEPLREELARRDAELVRLGRRETARRMLSEHGLPSPDHSSPTARVVTSPELFESLLAAEDDAAVRALIEERARLVRSLEGSASTGAQSRDQMLIESLFRPLNAKAFAATLISC